MKRHLPALIFVVVSCVTLATAQTEPIVAERPAPPTIFQGMPRGPVHVEVDIREQPDSPLRLVQIDPAVRASYPGAPVNLRNDGSTPISGAVIRVEGDAGGGSTVIVFGTKGLVAGQSKFQNAPANHAKPGNGDKPVVSVDFVMLADGRTWGADLLGRSRDIKQFLEGQNLALTRLTELLAGQEDVEIRKALDVFGSSSFSGPNTMPGVALRQMNFADRGYDSIIMVLRHIPKQRERGQDLARQLEIAARK